MSSAGVSECVDNVEPIEEQAPSVDALTLPILDMESEPNDPVIIPSSEICTMYRDPSTIPLLNVIRAIEVPNAPVGAAFSISERQLYDYMIRSPHEQIRYMQSGRTTISWANFARRWSYWAHVETALGEAGYQLRTSAQLKQRKKDLAKRLH